MMGMVLAGVFFALAVLSLMMMEAVREIVDRKRVRKTGIGGTQDVHLIGMSFTVVFVTISAALLLAAWF